MSHARTLSPQLYSSTRRFIPLSLALFFAHPVTVELATKPSEKIWCSFQVMPLSFETSTPQSRALALLNEDHHFRRWRVGRKPAICCTHQPQLRSGSTSPCVRRQSQSSGRVQAQALGSCFQSNGDLFRLRPLQVILVEKISRHADAYSEQSGGISPLLRL